MCNKQSATSAHASILLIYDPSKLYTHRRVHIGFADTISLTLCFYIGLQWFMHEKSRHLRLT
jgi:hypothetical protein